MVLGERSNRGAHIDGSLYAAVCIVCFIAIMGTGGGRCPWQSEEIESRGPMVGPPDHQLDVTQPLCARQNRRDSKRPLSVWRYQRNQLFVHRRRRQCPCSLRHELEESVIITPIANCFNQQINTQLPPQNEYFGE